MISKNVFEQKATYFKQHNITIVDAVVEMLFTTMDPEAPITKIVVDKFAENRKVEFENEDIAKEFLSQWTELSALCMEFVSSMKNDDGAYAQNAQLIATDIGNIAFEDRGAPALCEMIIASMDIIVFVYNRFFELQSMIRELFQYEIEGHDEFAKIIENTCLTFSQECRHFDSEKVYSEFFNRVVALFNQSLVLVGIAHLSSMTREKKTH